MYTLYINNRHGSLVYQKDFLSDVKLTANDRIRLASTFHGLSAIAAQISPVNTSKRLPFGFLQTTGISLIEAEGFRIQCFETLTGLKFFAVASSTFPAVILDSFLKQVYEVYTDYVLKNPFHDIDMPIRCELFDRAVENLFNSIKGLG
ncbi:unnamed protein product [Vitrella brassicaformis CCMP3155]|uniref:Trafficking protein particle complex subunit n=1 Tax=Vitrella brassicaformis (strain CCMP3155) TaxID=1169540 RepID=A0A0G4FSW5_VITBC|nr:unnamed protein product [Vitrella brassicaformis CCMP3155]|mmetsp:Transcript_20476/g.49835  ORF Transcript_20476/g.49835 Transcript_20476/m.49835 type:complete len:148 (+) Transcript_20476:20-463(+)|eukprot:CEM17410.1 unnamed protein product [Vitrella brassicaformis CCMP3155]